MHEELRDLITDPDWGPELPDEIRARLQASLASKDRIPLEEVRKKAESRVTRQLDVTISHLDAAIARRISDKIQWLAEHYDQVRPETLTGPFASL